MPLIGITSGRKLEDYKQSILHVGGEVRIVDASMTVDDALAGIDGLMLTGGDDVAPERYGEPAHAAVVEAEPGRDEFEFALVKAARDRHLPLFAICRGIQVLNVAMGGTLIQDIPDEVGTTVEHRVKEPRFAIAHDVWLTSNSLLERTLRERLEDADSCAVNSRHHQAPKDVGGGLTVSATAPDGVIEALEDPNRRFVLGVQWHPEEQGDRRPFDALVRAAQRYAEERSVRRSA